MKGAKLMLSELITLTKATQAIWEHKSAAIKAMKWMF